jgi:hypothetical protein
LRHSAPGPYRPGGPDAAICARASSRSVEKVDRLYPVAIA